MSDKPSREKTQSEAFIQAARELGCDESEEAFEQVVRKVAVRKQAVRPDEGKPQDKPGQQPGVKS